MRRTRSLWVAFVFVLSACTPPTPGALPLAAEALRTSPVPAARLDQAVGVLVTEDGDEQGLVAHRVDPRTLEDQPGYAPIDLQSHYVGALSPDGRTWAVISWPPSDYAAPLRLIDLESWRDSPMDLHYFDRVSLLRFTPDSGRLILAGNSGVWMEDVHTQLHIIEVEKAQEVGSVRLDFEPQLARFSADGERLYLYGPNWDGYGLAKAPHAAAVDVSTGEALWSLRLEGVRHGSSQEPPGEPGQDPIPSRYQPGVAFSQDGRWLYLVHADEDRLTTVDLARGSATTVVISDPLSPLERLLRLTSQPAYAKGPLKGAEKTAALSPDGTRLYVAGLRTEIRRPEGRSSRFDISQVPLELEVIDPGSGVRLASAKLGVTEALPSPDGQWLYLTHNRIWPELDQPGSNAERPGLIVAQAGSLSPVAEFAPGASHVRLDLFPGAGVACLTWWEDSATPEAEVQLIDLETQAVIASRQVPGWLADLVLVAP